MQNVVVVDDHKVFAELLAMALSGEPDFACVGHAQNVDEGMALVEAVHPDLVIMDVQLGDGDGIAATAELTERFPDLRVVVLTAHVDQRLLQRAAAANASALLPKDGDLPDMLSACDRHGAVGSPCTRSCCGAWSAARRCRHRGGHRSRSGSRRSCRCSPRAWKQG